MVLLKHQLLLSKKNHHYQHLSAILYKHFLLSTLIPASPHSSTIINIHHYELSIIITFINQNQRNQSSTIIYHNHHRHPLHPPQCPLLVAQPAHTSPRPPQGIRCEASVLLTNVSGCSPVVQEGQVQQAARKRDAEGQKFEVAAGFSR